jgi:hypothetical protein
MLTLRRFSLVTLALVAALALTAAPALANHSVWVEGDVDWDGDGLLGVDEDMDDDGVYGTLNGGVDAVGLNGAVTVVTTGQFNEVLEIDNPGGNLVIQAAPGVMALLEAFRPPGNDPANTTRQNATAIHVNDSTDPAAVHEELVTGKAHGGSDDGERVVILRNLHIRNYNTGVRATGTAHVTIDNVTFDSNVAWGVFAQDSSRVTVSNSLVLATGRRTTPAPDLTDATPGVGIEAADFATIDVFNTVVTNSIGAGIANTTEGRALFRVRVNDVITRDNALGLDTFGFEPARFDRATQAPPNN